MHRGRIITPGKHGDTFAERLCKRRGAPGSIGQFINLSLPFTSIADPRGLANIGGLGGEFGVPNFLWVAGDGNAPTIGPALAATGTPDVDVTPWQLGDGIDVASEYYNGLEGRYGANAEAGDLDSVVFLTFNRGETPQFRRPFSTRAAVAAANDGVELTVYTSNRVAFFVYVGGVAVQAVSTTGDSPENAWIQCIGIYNAASKECRVLTPGFTSAATAVGVGNVAGTNFGVGGINGVANLIEGSIAFVSYMRGAGIAALYEADTFALCQDLFRRFSALHPIAGDATAFARNSAASWEDHNGIWHIASQGCRGRATRTGCEPLP